MASARQAERRERIEEAAFSALNDVGYNSASLLLIAGRARASNETLYKWYGNKQGLFRSLVEANAARVKSLLEKPLGKKEDPLATLAEVGPVLLAMVTSERAVVLSRAAAADVKDSNTLGPAIAQFGRNTVVPLLRRLLEQLAQAGCIAADDLDAATEIYVRLLIGDLQVRRVIGAIAELQPDEIQQRSRQALDVLLKLYKPDHAAKTEQGQ